MEELSDKLEYAVRFALKSSNHNLAKAVKVAQAKFGSMVERDPSAEEVREIRMLVHDINAKQQEAQGIPSVVGFD